VINPPYEADNPINFTISALNYLEDSGRLVIIMPNNTLSKATNAKAAQKILDHAQLDFVIDMPQQLFFEQGRGVKTSIFGFTKTNQGHRHDSLVTFVDLEDDGHEVRYGAGRRDTGRWADIRTEVERAVRDRVEAKAARSWRSPIYDGAGILNARGVRRNPWPNHQVRDLGSAIADWQEARAQRREAYERMNEALLDAGIGGIDA